VLLRKDVANSGRGAVEFAVLHRLRIVYWLIYPEIGVIFSGFIS
jgi:hypothetical protein